MAVMKTAISWTDSTWNPTTGCTKVSDGCLHCYAEALTNRLWGGGFDQVKLHPKRLRQVHGFQPIKEGDRIRPRMVFVNSMSDLMHKDIPDSFRDDVFAAMELQPQTVFQVLTKRAMTLGRYIGKRFDRGRKVPPHIWLGVSVENNTVKQRLDVLRRMKHEVGEFTAFISVEPLVGPVDQHRYDGIDWVLIGGESGGQARPMDIAWARTARDEARRVGAAVWFKQFGTWRNNPLYQQANGRTHMERVHHAIRAGEKAAEIGIEGNKPKVLGEKGGATLDGEVLHELPPAYQVVQQLIDLQAARLV